jgi:hypothetical protein
VSLSLVSGPVASATDVFAHSVYRDEAWLLDALDNTFWLADGAPSDRQIYILGPVSCAECRDLYARTRRLPQQVQLRWVPLAPGDDAPGTNAVCEAATVADSEALEHIFGASANSPACSTPVARDNTVRWNRGILGTIEGVLARLNAQGDSIAYPCLVWLSPAGVHVQVRPMQLDAILASVASRPEQAASTALARETLVRETRTEGAPRGDYFAREKGVTLFALPSVFSPRILVLDQDFGCQARSRTIVGNEAWIELKCLSGPATQILFGRESQLFRVSAGKRFLYHVLEGPQK